MRKRFSKSYFWNQFQVCLALTALCLVFMPSCKCKRECQGLDGTTEQIISDGIKSAILDFPADTSWAFRNASDTNIVDTIFLGAKPVYTFEKGECALMDKSKCCSYYYNEKSERPLTVHSNSNSHNTFTEYYTNENGFGIKGDWGKILILNHIYSQDFLGRFNQTLKLRDTTLSDVRSDTVDYVNDATPLIVAWSKENGLVMYAYKVGTDTIEYERSDFK